MALIFFFKNLLSLILPIIILFSLLTLSFQSQPHNQHHHYPYFRTRRRIIQQQPSTPTTPFRLEPSRAYGEWQLLQKSIGVSAMHMQLLHNNKVVIFDRTDFGPSNLSLPPGICRSNDEILNPDCTAHSLLYDVSSNTFRPLFVHTDVWCSSGALIPNGTLVQTGGYHAGDHRIRLFTPCDHENCDWVELNQNLTFPRWYSSTQILPDGRVIIVGGRRSFNYEFFPKNLFSLIEVFDLPFLYETTDYREENNLYPFLHLLPDGNLFIFANRRSILLDYVSNRVLRRFPPIPGAKRSYPSTGSSVLLPLRLSGWNETVSPEVEVMVCGGAAGGSFLKATAKIFLPASKSCGRLKLSDPEPRWVMEIMPMGRIMPDMLLLPTGDVIIINGASKGTAGWERAVDPVLHPVLYVPTQPDLRMRFRVLNPTRIPRMYHSAATLLPDGRILVGGSNPHVVYNFTEVRYPTELSLEAFLPPYLAPKNDHLRPYISLVDEVALSYGQEFSIAFTLELVGVHGGLTVTMINPSFTTHSSAMNQRLLVLDVVDVEQWSPFDYNVTVYAPPKPAIAPPGYYMVFVVHAGIPSHCVWTKIS
ncbi:hypothetical protein LguiA_000336 [Lonicera macranthoides]